MARVSFMLKGSGEDEWAMQYGIWVPGSQGIVMAFTSVHRGYCRWITLPKGVRVPAPLKPEHKVISYTRGCVLTCVQGGPGHQVRSERDRAGRVEQHVPPRRRCRHHTRGYVSLPLPDMQPWLVRSMKTGHTLCCHLFFMGFCAACVLTSAWCMI
jgi:hypothetical protein